MDVMVILTMTYTVFTVNAGYRYFSDDFLINSAVSGTDTEEAKTNCFPLFVALFLKFSVLFLS